LLVHELFPLACGLLVGSVLAFRKPTGRWGLSVLLSIVLGFAATVISGEFWLGWEFLLVDIPLVALTTVAAYVALGSIARRRADT
jgi:hypothetical protein